MSGSRAVAPHCPVIDAVAETAPPVVVPYIYTRYNTRNVAQRPDLLPKQQVAGQQPQVSRRCETLRPRVE